ncbi:MAG: T9SS type A sorting domain-containing protein [Flavobacteriales bacterium]|nr:T9SS type A sorting domain-containing protein [Flavobacteriales bacterium]MDG2246491.1 T9SS type A sorting domain-containing protein [Flavobacteriales bacterium]
MKNLFLSLFILCSIGAWSQCLTGTISVSGAGCGCLSNCDLSNYGGPDCNSGSTGNCNAGQVSMSVDIALPGDCEVSVEARMSTRPGCSASGADGGDKLRVNGTNPHAWQTGSGNSTLFDTNTQVGGTITVEGTANRADEIITYEVFYESGTCPFCILLPVELVTFDAVLEGNTLGLFWETASELNNEGFIVQKSEDQAVWKDVSFIAGQGTTNNWSQYSKSLNLTGGVWYIRLKQVDTNGAFAFSPVLAVEVRSLDSIDLSAEGDHVLLKNAGNYEERFVVEIYNANGQLVTHEEVVLASGASNLIHLGSGMNIVSVYSNQHRKVERFFNN